MNKAEFTFMLIEQGINYVKVVRTPDFRGGYEPVAMFNEIAHNYELKEFEYVEFDGDIAATTENYDTLFESVYDRGVQIIDYLPLARIVENRIYEHE